MGFRLGPVDDDREAWTGSESGDRISFGTILSRCLAAAGIARASPEPIPAPIPRGREPRERPVSFGLLSRMLVDHPADLSVSGRTRTEPRSHCPLRASKAG